MTDNELNALVAERVMGREVYQGEFPYDSPVLIVPGSWGWVEGYGSQPEVENCPDYANDIAAAFDAFTQASKKSYMKLYYSDVEEMWCVSFPDEQHTIRDKSPSRAMNFAALKTVGDEI